VRQQARDALVDQARLFVARHHLDRKAQHLLRAAQELVAVARFAQGLGGHGAHLVLLEAVQAFAKTRQAFPAALHGGRAEVLFGVEPVALAHRFLEVLHALDVARVEAPDLEAKAVGAEVDRGEKGSVLHGEKTTGDAKATGRRAADCDACPCAGPPPPGRRPRFL
jgi:hypothetical protein